MNFKASSGQKSFLLIFLFILRLRHVDVYQTLQQVSEREGICLQTDGFRLCSGEERVNESFINTPLLYDWTLELTNVPLEHHRQQI